MIISVKQTNNTLEWVDDNLKKHSYTCSTGNIIREEHNKTHVLIMYKENELWCGVILLREDGHVELHPPLRYFDHIVNIYQDGWNRLCMQYTTYKDMKTSGIKTLVFTGKKWKRVWTNV